MDSSNDRVRQSTRVLKRLVGATLAQQKASYYGTEPPAFLLLEPNCSGLPVSLIEDGVLEPVDKLIWLVLMVRASRGQGIASFPPHLELARSANVATRQTASRALSILRCRRWLTVCHTSWCKDGQRKGSAYALHTAPLPIADTIYLDSYYETFLSDLIGQHQDRVQKAASDVFGHISHQTI